MRGTATGEPPKAAHLNTSHSIERINDPVYERPSTDEREGSGSRSVFLSYFGKDRIGQNASFVLNRTTSAPSPEGGRKGQRRLLEAPLLFYLLYHGGRVSPSAATSIGGDECPNHTKLRILSPVGEAAMQRDGGDPRRKALLNIAAAALRRGCRHSRDLPKEGRSGFRFLPEGFPEPCAPLSEGRGGASFLWER